MSTVEAKKVTAQKSSVSTVGMSSTSGSICIICGHTTERSDVMRKHYERQHKTADNCLGDHPSGKTIVCKHPKKEAIIVLQHKSDPTKHEPIAFCFGCSHELTTPGHCPDKLAYFGMHVCKEKLKRAPKQPRAASSTIKIPATTMVDRLLENGLKKSDVLRDLTVYTEGLTVDVERTLDKIALRLQSQTASTISESSSEICWSQVFDALKNERTTRFLDHRVADFKDDALEELQEENEDADLTDVVVDHKFIVMDIVGFASKAELAIKNNAKKITDMQIKMEQTEDAYTLKLREAEKEIQKLKDTIANMAYSHQVHTQALQEESEAAVEKAASLGFLEAIKKVEKAYSTTIDIESL